ncbi:MAG: hypothetical protein ABR502_08805 [Chitinophagaceae bacterium]
MVPQLRKSYNEQFSKEKYQAFLQELNSFYPGHLDFRVAETPIFIPKDFKEKVLDVCESIIDVITQPQYQQQSKKAVPSNLFVPGEDERPHFICFDFGICHGDHSLEPQLIEMQGFPSLFAYEVLYSEVFKKHFPAPDNYDDYLSGLSKESYLQLLHKIIVSNNDSENVILLEIFPHQQKTRIDFYCTERYLGIKTVCLTELIKEDNMLYYLLNGRKVPIHRIYNRLIFDDLFQQPIEVQEKGKLFQEELNVEWIPHPNWFYRISKYSLPFIKHPYVPETRFLNELQSLPEDLENYVVKPLFSFAGQGVIIDVEKEAIEKINDPENWILQRKVKYASMIQTPDEPAKAEMRIFYFWEPGKPRPIAANNLARLSKGKMIGVRYNKDREWVGGSLCLFEK